MQARGINQDDFAVVIGCSQPHISKLASGDVRPSLETLLKIERATDGAVTARDFAPDEPETMAS